MRVRLRNAVVRGDVDEVRRLITAGADPNAVDRDGWSPLHDAAWGDRPEIATLLIQAGAKVNRLTSDGTSPLHQAALADCFEVAEVLLKAGADPNLKRADGTTPLDLCISRYSSLIGGANALVQGKAPQQHAGQEHHTLGREEELLKLMHDWGVPPKMYVLLVQHGARRGPPLGKTANDRQTQR